MQCAPPGTRPASPIAWMLSLLLQSSPRQYFLLPSLPQPARCPCVPVAPAHGMRLAQDADAGSARRSAFSIPTALQASVPRVLGLASPDSESRPWAARNGIWGSYSPATCPSEGEARARTGRHGLSPRLPDCCGETGPDSPQQPVVLTPLHSCYRPFTVFFLFGASWGHFLSK